MQYFTKKARKFLADLEINNNRDWFTANKTIFTSEVEFPFIQLVGDMIAAIEKKGVKLNCTAKDCVFRIYRDVRFSKDKTPYKNHVSAIFTPGGRKNIHRAGSYLELSANNIRLFAGVYEPDKDNLLKIRNHLAKNITEFGKIINAKKFIDSFSEVKGDKSKIIPKELKEAAARQELIYNKSFYVIGELSEKFITSEDLLKKLMELYTISQSFNEFFDRALR